MFFPAVGWPMIQRRWSAQKNPGLGRRALTGGRRSESRFRLPAAALEQQVQRPHACEVPEIGIPRDERHVVIQAALRDQRVREAGLSALRENVRSKGTDPLPVAFRSPPVAGAP